MSDNPAPPGNSSDHSYYLAINGTPLILVGLLCGPAVLAAPYPRLMLSAQTIFLGVATRSIFAALLLKTSLSILGNCIARIRGSFMPGKSLRIERRVLSSHQGQNLDFKEGTSNGTSHR